MENEEKKSRRGGRRDGAGRKPTGRTKHTATFTLSPEIIELLDARGRGKSAYIESLIRRDNGLEQSLFYLYM